MNQIIKLLKATVTVLIYINNVTTPQSYMCMYNNVTFIKF